MTSKKCFPYFVGSWQQEWAMDPEVLVLRGREAITVCVCYSFLRAGCLRWECVSTHLCSIFLSLYLGHSWSPWSPRDHRKHGTSRCPGATCEYAAVARHPWLVYVFKFTSISVGQKCLFSTGLGGIHNGNQRSSWGKDWDQTVHMAWLETDGPNRE